MGDDGAACVPLPFATDDYRTRQVRLSGANFNLALQASCSIPFVLQAVHNIPGAPPAPTGTVALQTTTCTSTIRPHPVMLSIR